MRAGRRPRGRLTAHTVASAFAGVLLLLVSVPNLGTAFAAARPEGVTGVFTARWLECVRHGGHESCSWSGEFRSAGGALLRPRTTLHGADRDTLTAGARARAVDIGRPGVVYPPEGSAEWVFLTLMTAVGVLALAVPFIRRTGGRPPRPGGAGGA